MPKKKPEREAQKGISASSQDDMLKQMQEQMMRMQLEIDILNETLKILKKDPGVNPSQLKNSEKVVIVDALGKKYSLPILLEAITLARSSYYYHKAQKGKTDKYTALRVQIKALFESTHQRYGYRRLQVLLKQEGRHVCDKVVRRLMKELGLVAKGRKRRRYSSYLGEISPAVPNILERNFQAEAPNEKWLTDLTEFSLKTGKVYLSPIVDCFDGLIVAWSLGPKADASLVNASLKRALAESGEVHPMLHSDRGSHYRWPEWIELTEEHQLTRSMSRKGCTGDNAACEGFFGRLKNECFYDHDFGDYTLDEFMAYIDEYIHWYNHHRIKVSLNGLSPVAYRKSLELIA